MSVCESCDGSGALTPDDVDVCATCEGHGRLRRMQRVGPFTQQVVSDCPACSGKGRTIVRSCTSCKGKGRLNKNKKVRFSIPPGIESGTRLRMSGYGEASRDAKGPPGHLYIEISHKAHEWFERDGSDLLMALPINFVDLTLGCELELPHMDGENLKIKVPRDQCLETRYRSKGEGSPTTVALGEGMSLLF